MTASSTRPYLIRAIHEWCADNGFTPYVSVAVDERTVVPREHVKGGEIVLNLSSGATNRLHIGNDLISFQARFSGVVRDLSIPIESVTAIYARENGHGMAFEVPKEPGQTAAERASVERAPRVLGAVTTTPKPAATSAPELSKVTAISPLVAEPTALRPKAVPEPQAELPGMGDPSDEPSGGGVGAGNDRRPGGRSGQRGRAKLTRIK